MRMELRLIAVLSALLLLSGCVPDNLCDQVVLDNCKTCNPTLDKVASAIKATGLKKALFTEVKYCADTTLNASIKETKWADAAFKGCLSANRNIDASARDFLIKQVESIKVSDDVYNAWASCVAIYVYGKGGTKRPLVLLMDSHIGANVYCERTRNIGGSNADDISYLLRDLPIKIGFEPTNLAWKNEQHVIDEHPDLVVVHASAFQEKTASMEGNTKLINFLRYLRGTGIHVLVYTRGLSTDAAPDTVDRFNALMHAVSDPELQKNSELFVMPNRQQACFDDPVDATPFKDKVKAMLGVTAKTSAVN